MLNRILSVADVSDAISSDRSYRKRMTEEMNEEQILQIIPEGSGTQFDPAVVEPFLRSYHRGVFSKADIFESDPPAVCSGRAMN